MTVIGVTGGIGSGKSTFCGFFQDRGVPVIYADNLAKELMVHDAALKNAIMERFGAESYFSDGTLNRAYLSDKAFAENRVSELNLIVHPVVKRNVLESIYEFQQKDYPLLVYEAALLLNQGKPDFIDVVIWIEADVNQRLERVSHRDKIDKKLVQQRIDKQITIETVREYVDIVIQNSGSLAELEEVANKLIQEYVR